MDDRGLRDSNAGAHTTHTGAEHGPTRAFGWFSTTFIVHQSKQGLGNAAGQRPTDKHTCALEQKDEKRKKERKVGR